MAGLLSCLGFPVETEEEFIALMEHAAEKGEKLPAEEGHYIAWTVGVGIELWVQVSPEDELIGLTPHFNAAALTSVVLDGRVYDPEGSELDGAFLGEVGGVEQEEEGGAIPLVFDAPDFACSFALELPGIFGVRLAAFAYEVAAFADQEAFEAAQGDEADVPVECFIPHGLYTDEGELADVPEAHAVISGRVLATETCTNPDTGNEFLWARVQTEGMAIEIVVNPQEVDGEMTTGAIIQGVFWISGRIQV